MTDGATTGPGGGISRRGKIILILGGLMLASIALGVIFGSAGKNEEYQPQNEFKLDPWITIKIGGIDMSINKAVLYLVLASAATIFTLRYIAKRMQERPNRVQTAVEAAYSLMKDNIAGGNMDRKTANKWFAFIGTLFLFIWFSNMIGYLPLPTKTEH
jgi:F-type H+-transporting ATPase subunit a